MTAFEPIKIEIIINAPASKIWRVLTEPELMKQWMSEEPLDIITDWKVGEPILVKGNIHEVYFESTGRVLLFEQGKRLSYEHLSSLSQLPDEPDSYSVLEFELRALNQQTHLKLTLSHFPTEAIYKHLKFYWEITVGILKKFAEGLPQE